ncbi:MAG: serine/threonine-protein kinase [Planctomycetota bacterium]
MGLVVHHYEILEQIGRGAMARVHKAKNKQTGAIVAVKFIAKEMLTNKKEMEALINEYEIGKKFDHPNLIRFFELIESQGNRYLFMEYCSGPTLRKLTHHRNKLTPQEQIELALGIAQGLYYLHSQYDKKMQVLFRDLKPENILMRDESPIKSTNVVLVDFGISQLLPRSSGMGGLLGFKKKASTEILGTNSYMSPEQTLGKVLDVRSDIYSFGVILFEIYTGRPPFLSGAQEKMYKEKGSFSYEEGAMSAQFMREYNEEIRNKHRTTPAPHPKQFTPTILPEIANLILKLLEKKPESRLQSMEYIVLELNKLKKRFGTKT